MKLYRFLRLFWVPKCRHKWADKGERKKDYENGYGRVVKISYERVCQCSKCGEWKSFEV